jgi:hypothetical protein
MRKTIAIESVGVGMMRVKMICCGCLNSATDLRIINAIVGSAPSQVVHANAGKSTQPSFLGGATRTRTLCVEMKAAMAVHDIRKYHIR